MTNKKCSISTRSFLNLTSPISVRTEEKCITNLSADHALPKPRQVGLAPGALAPGHDLPEVGVEVELGQLVVHEVAYVPGQIVVAVDEGHLAQGLAHLLEPLAAARRGRRLAKDGSGAGARPHPHAQPQEQQQPEAAALEAQLADAMR